MAAYYFFFSAMKSLILVCGDLKVRKVFILAVLLGVIFTQKLDDIVLAAKFGSSNDSRNQTTQVVDKLIGFQAANRTLAIQHLNRLHSRPIYFCTIRFELMT